MKKKIIKKENRVLLLFIILGFMSLFIFSRCSSDDDDDTFVVEYVTYDVAVKAAENAMIQYFGDAANKQGFYMGLAPFKDVPGYHVYEISAEAGNYKEGWYGTKILYMSVDTKVIVIEPKWFGQFDPDNLFKLYKND